MTKFTFVILTPHFANALIFYRDLLGIGLKEEWTDFGHGALLEAMPDVFVELIDSPEAAPLPAEARTAFMGLELPDANAVYGRLLSAGAPVKGPPTTKPWGGRAFTAFDPDGMPVNVYDAPSASAGIQGND